MFCLKTEADDCKTPLPAVLGLPPQAVPSLRPLPVALIRKRTSQLLRMGAHTQNRCLIPAVRVYTGKKPETGNARRRSACHNPQGILSRTKPRSRPAHCVPRYEPARNGKFFPAYSASTSAGRSAARNPHGESGALSAATGSRGHGLLHQAAP